MRDFNRSGGSSRFAGRDFGKRNFSSRGNDRPEMFQAVCAECGKDCEVPFKPSANKQVFCSRCFEARGGNDAAPGRHEERNFNRFDESYGNRPGRGSSNFEHRDREMFTATCDECGKSCQLPFRPSNNKPVYCSDCFNMRGERSGLHNHSDERNTENKGSDTGKEIRELKDQVLSLNVKLDKIMKALAINPEKIQEPKTLKVTKSEFTEATNVVVPVAEVTTVAAPKKAKAVKKPAKKKTVAKKAE
jgi:CxxC-x17-CxxC domain-containing protein